MPRHLTFVLALGLALAAAACVPPEKPENLGKRWDATTVMGELQERGTLRVGVSPNSPLRVEGQPGPYERFTTSFAAFLADILGVELVEVEVPVDSIRTGIDTGDIDIAFPIAPVTEEAVRKQAFADPIFVAHQRILAPLGVTSESFSSYCAILDPATGWDPSSVDTNLRVIVERDPANCIRALQEERAEAITALDIILASVNESMAGSGEIVGDQLTTVGLSPQLKTGAQAWVDYVNQVFDKWIETGEWRAAHDAYLSAPLGDQEEPRPPDLTLEEAAALFPSS